MIDGRTVATLFNIIYPLCAAAGFLTCFYKLRDLRKNPRNRALMTLVAARAWPALSFTFATPAIYTAFDRAVGVPNLATLLVYGFIVCNSVTAQALLLLWSRPATEAKAAIPGRLAVFATVLVVMVALFALTDTRGEHAIDFDVRYARTPSLAIFLVVYLGSFAIGLASTVRMTWQFSNVVPNPWLRRGLRLNAVGAILGLGYATAKMTSIVARWVGSDQLDIVNVFWAPCSASAGALLIALSSSLPAWAPKLDQGRAYRRLEPLWRRLHEVDPTTALDPPTHLWFDRWNPVNLDDRLYRRYVEIRDGWLALRPRFDAEVAERARDLAHQAKLTGGQQQAVVEAATILAAIRNDARRNGASASGPAAKPPGSDDFAGDVAWLVSVAQAMVRSPLVQQAQRPSPASAQR